MRHYIYFAGLVIVALLLSFSAHAVAVDDNPLPDQAQEAKARAIMGDIRCLVCQNQSIEDSNAPLAKDLRDIVRAQIAAGSSPDEVKSYLVERYGDWVLLKPPLNIRTLALWLFPPLLLLGALLFILARARRTPVNQGPTPLSDAEQKRLDMLLAQSAASSHGTHSGKEGTDS